MKLLLVGINAKFIHTCPAIYSLRAYAKAYGGQLPQIALAEYTINDRYGDVLDAILQEGAEVIAFSTYIWNTDRSRRLVRDIRRVREDVILLAGGPEAGHAPEGYLRDGVDLCLCGEGEETFLYLAECLGGMGSLPPLEELKQKKGFAFLEGGTLVHTGYAPAVDMDRIPFLYERLPLPENRILYYESSRGCPFSCAYCLSGRERGIRTRNLSTVRRELQYFLDQKVPQVKFVDRTFNAIPSHAMAIWNYIKEHDNGVTNFHFEIEAGRMTQEEISLLQSLRPGLVQMEVGVQSVNAQTLGSVHRSPDLYPIRRLMKELLPLQNINLHLDLIAGLPFEDLPINAPASTEVYTLRPHQLQVGFLKLLPGTSLYEEREAYGLVASADPPYEILKTRWLSYQELGFLHRFADTVEIYVNSQGFRHSLPLLEGCFPDPFTLFLGLADYLQEKGYHTGTISQQKRYAILEDFVKEWVTAEGPAAGLPLFFETLRFDFLLHVHKSRHMQAEEVLDLGEGRKRYRFDYKKTSPVNGEAAYEVLDF